MTLALTLAVAAMYWGGLSGGFLLDDTPNLGVIAQLPPDPGLRDMLNLAATGFAGIFGRSISIFSFLLQHESWPDPRNFKLVNLLIHLVNGGLLALCCALIAKQWRSRSLPIVALAAIVFIWLAHPIQVSSVLYVVQRMTLLSGTFTLLSIIFYLLGRKFLLEGENAHGIELMFIGLVVFAILGILSKENGVLVYLYVLVLEYTLFGHERSSKSLLKFRRMLLLATLVIAVVGLSFIMPGTIQGYELKPFGFAERTLTQFSVLGSYIASIALLMPSSFGIFHDDYPSAEGVSLSLSILFIVGLIVAALIRRERWPLFSFAVLWYFAGHALESTFLPLEYYFEHRNYLPLFGPVFAVVVFLSDRLVTLDALARKAVMAFAAVALIFMSTTTVRHTTLWGDVLMQAYAAVEQHPDSARAQSNMVEKLSSAGQLQAAFDYHLSVLEPESLGIPPYIRWLEFSCILPGVEMPDDERLRMQASQASHDYSAVFALNNLVFAMLEGRCPTAPAGKVNLVLDGLAKNPNYEVSHPDIVFYQALMQAAVEEFGAAAQLAAEAFRLRPDVRVGLYRVNWLSRSGRNDVALEELQQLTDNFGDEIAASADLSDRYRFMLSRLGAAVD